MESSVDRRRIRRRALVLPTAARVAALAVPGGVTALGWTEALAQEALAPLTLFVPTPARQGRTLVIEVETGGMEAPLSVSGSLGRTDTASVMPLRFFPAGETRFRAFAGLPVDAPIGPWTVTVAAGNSPGPEPLTSQTADLEVVDGGFRLQRLVFAPDLLSLLDPQVGDMERLTLATVVAESAPAPLWRGRFRLPVTGPLVTSHGARRDYLDPAGNTLAHSQHGGIDIAAPWGTPILAPAAGTVAFAGRWSIRGNVVILDHGTGVHTVHGHMMNFAVAPGQTVAAGQPVGYVGSTGLSTGPHLHWEVRVNGVAVEPLEWTERNDLAVAV